MKKTHIALIWAAGILATAFYTNEIGLNAGASFGITMGMVGAAYGSILGKSGRCKKACS